VSGAKERGGVFEQVKIEFDVLVDQQAGKRENQGSGSLEWRTEAAFAEFGLLKIL
jgi:hypothetical protein